MKQTRDLLALAKRFAQLPDAQRKLFISKLGDAGIDFRLLPVPPRANPSAAVPASFSQTRLWLHAFIIDEPAAYHVTGRLRLDGALDAAALRRAFDALIARHETLRTTFSEGAGGVEQVVRAPSRCPWDFIDLSAMPLSDQHRVAEGTAVESEARPFDLASETSIRVRLIRFDTTTHWLALTMHHIAADGWSIEVLLDELAVLYRVYTDDAALTLASLPVQYADYAQWQRRWLEAGEGQRQLEFWRSRLDAQAGALALPGSSPRPRRRSARGARHYLTLDASLTKGVHTLAKAQRATPFAVLLAVLYTLLARASGERVIQIGVPAANRERPETVGLIGFFVNTLVISAQVAPRMSFRELVDQVQNELLNAQSHQDLPFEQIVEALGVARSASHHPLFQVMASYAVHRALPTLGGVRMTDLPAGAPYAKFDLTLGFEEREDGALDAALIYATDILNADAVARVAGHYAHLVEQATLAPDMPIAELEWLTAQEREQVAAWNSYALANMPFTPVHVQIARYAQNAPDARAVADSNGSLTRAELEARADCLARRLIEAGVGAETRVGIAVGRSTDLFVGLLGILKAGGAFVPLDPSHPRERLAHIIGDAVIEHVIMGRKHVLKLPLRPGARVWLVDGELDGGPNDASSEATGASITHTPIETRVAPGQAAYLIYTSGSTGKPKGVVVEHGALAMHCAAIVARYGMREADRVLHFMSINFDGAHECWMAPLAAGVDVRITDDVLWSPAQTCETIAREGVTIAAFPPGYAMQMSEWASTHVAPPSLRSLTVGGEATSRETFAAMRRAFPRVRIVNGYGPTETVITPLLWMIDADEDSATVTSAYLPIGTPVGERTAHVLDASLRPLPVGVTGELYLGGTGVARGYHARAALTAERFLPDPFGANGARLYRTGDLVRRRADGVLEFVGRFDHQVKMRGLRIELGEIEAHLAAHPDVRDAIAVVRGSGSNAMLAAYVELGEAAAQRDAQVDGDALSAHLRRTLPDYMVPADIVILDTLPRNANRKIDRAALPEPVRVERTFSPPAPGAETVLARIWCEVLGVERVGRADHFFELGGHSLAAASVATRVAERLAHAVPVRSLFEAPTFAAYAVRVTEAPRVGLQAQRRDSRNGGAPSLGASLSTNVSGPLSAAQLSLWFLWRAQPDSAAYNIPVALRLRGTLNVDALRAAFDHAGRRHPALRTRLVEMPGSLPRQIVLPRVPASLPVVDLREDVSLEARLTQATRLTDEDALQPFDLARAPLWRARLLRVANDDHVLSVVIHHIVADGRSIEIFIETVSRAYLEMLSGVAPDDDLLDAALTAIASPEPPQSDLAFWRDVLNGAAALPLPRPQASPTRPATPQWQAGRIAFAFDNTLALRARKLALSANGTLPMLLHAALNLALTRATGVVDQSVGVLTSTRNTENEFTIGLFINAVVVRTITAASASPLDAIATVRDAALSAYAHATTPFARVVEALRAPRVANSNPLFKVLFNYLRPTVSGTLDWGGLTLEAFNDVRHRVVFDLELDIVEHPDGRVTGAFSYACELVDRGFVKQLVDDYCAIVAHFVDAPRGAFKQPANRSYANIETDAQRPVNLGASVLPCEVAHLADTLIQTWSDTFGGAPLTTSDNLFEVGATSFDVMRFVDVLTSKGYLVTIADVFSRPTIATLAMEVSARHTHPGAPTSQPKPWQELAMESSHAQ